MPASSTSSQKLPGALFRIIPGVATQSLGTCEYHSLEKKLRAAERSGFRGVELFWDDLVQCACINHQSEDQDSAHQASKVDKEDSCNSSNPVSELRPMLNSVLCAAREVHKLCAALHLHVISLQPFRNYEGLRDRLQHRRRVDEFEIWLMAAQLLETRLIVIPSNFLPPDQLLADQDVAVEDLREVAELALNSRPHPIEIGYEALAWGTHVSTWHDANTIVKAVDRPNFRIVLDTFNIAGREWADPCDEVSGVIGADRKVADHFFTESLKPLHGEIDLQNDVCLLQVADGERMHPPVSFHATRGAVCCQLMKSASTSPSGSAAMPMPPRMAWSRGHRLFYGEEQKGAYLPIKQCLKAILGLESTTDNGDVSQRLELSNNDTDAQHELAPIKRHEKLVNGTTTNKITRDNAKDEKDEAASMGKVWLSMEVFSHSAADPRDGVVEEHAQRAWASWERIRCDLNLRY